MNIDLLFDNIVFVFLPAAFLLILGICIFIKYSKKQPYEVYRNKYLPYILAVIPMYIGLFIIMKHFFNERAIAFMIIPIFIIGIMYIPISIIYNLVLRSIIKKNGFETSGIASLQIRHTKDQGEISYKTFIEYFAIYENDNGESIYAKIINPKKDLKAGEKIRIKYISNKPEKVYYIGKDE